VRCRVKVTEVCRVKVAEVCRVKVTEVCVVYPNSRVYEKSTAES
jgi:hypothetical protein